MFGLIFLRRLHITSKTFGSALYVTGQQQASGTYSFLTPHLDCESKFKNIEKLKENINARKLDINVEGLQKSWEFLQNVKETKHKLELRREETATKIKSLLNDQSKENEIKPLKILGKMVRENLKVITKEIWELEEVVLVKVLSLPNDLHSETPLDVECVVSEFGVKPSSEPSVSHIEIAQNLGLLKYSNEHCYYLEKSAALFEWSATQYVSDFFNSQGYIMTSNSDFAKSLIVEGCGENHTNSDCVFILQPTESSHNENAALHLIGGSSLASNCAFFTKHFVQLNSNKLMKFFSIGRHYSPIKKENMPSLLNIAQIMASDIFLIGPNNDESQVFESFQETLNDIVNFYTVMGWHFRVVKCSASQLKLCESLKYSIQMYSRHLECYVEVGSISYCGTYMSKRLLMKYQNVCGESDFLNVVAGRIINVPRVLACLLEETEGEFKFPNKLLNMF